MCTSSILHLCTISFERYLAIRNPLASRNRSKTAVRIKIFLVWAASSAISSPIMILGIVDEKNILNENQCVLSNNDFIIYGSVSAFFIPLGIMGILFGFTIHLLRSQWRMCDPRQRKDGELNMRRFKTHHPLSFRNRVLLNGVGKKTKPRRTKSYPEPRNIFTKKVTENGEHDPNNSAYQIQQSNSNLSNTTADSESSVFTPPTSPALSQSSSDFKLSFQQFRQQSAPISETDEEDNPGKNLTVSTETTFTPLPSSVEHISTYSTEFEPSKACNNRHSYANDSSPSEDKHPEMPKTYSAPSSLHEILKSHQSMYHRPSPSTHVSKKDSVRQKHVKNTVKTEQKASKTLFILFMTFVVCWAPFFAVNVLSVVCKSCELNHLMVTIFVWLGYVSSTLNPIIYTVFNKTFRTTFIKLLKCEYRTIQKPMRIKAICVGLHSIQDRTMTSSIPL